MSTTRRFRSVVAILAIAALAFTGCGDDDDPESSGSGSGGDGGSGSEAASVETIEEGVLTVCSDVPYEPFEMEGDGPSGYTGFDIELLAAVGAESDLELSVSDVDFDGILGNLAAETCDVVASAVTITDERAQEVDFTEPYFDAEQSLLVPAESDITALADVEGRLGVQSGTTGETYANENAPDGAEVVAFDGADALFAALASGDIVAILQDFPVNAYRTTQDDTLEVVETFPTDEQYGFAVAKGNEQLLTALDDGLAAVRESGDYDTIYGEYFGTE
jgi:polar amino acid transport system substrate-binding protein